MNVCVCYDCAKINDLMIKYLKSDLHIMRGMDGPKCFFCEQDKGGSDIDIDTNSYWRSKDRCKIGELSKKKVKIVMTKYGYAQAILPIFVS